MNTCRFFPSGKVVLSGGADLRLKIWSAEDGSCPVTLKGHTGGRKPHYELSETDYAVVMRPPYMCRMVNPRHGKREGVGGDLSQSYNSLTQLAIADQLHVHAIVICRSSGWPVQQRQLLLCLFLMCQQRWLLVDLFLCIDGCSVLDVESSGQAEL